MSKPFKMYRKIFVFSFGSAFGNKYNKASCVTPRRTKAWFFAVLLLLAGCVPTQKPIVLGLAVNLSGRGGTAGEYIRDGAMLAVRDINEKGGVHGRKLQLLVKDDQGSEEGVIAANENLLSSGVLAIIGHSVSDHTITAHRFLMGKSTLLITGYTATEKLSGMDDHFFRTSVDVKMYGEATSKLLEEKKSKVVAVVMDLANKSFVQEYLTQTAHHFKGRLVPVMMNSSGKISYQSIAKQINQLKPDTVLLLNEVSVCGVLSQMLRRGGYRGKLVATLWAQTPDLMRYGGKSVEGLSLVTFIDPQLDNPRYRAFEGRMKSIFGKKATARSVRAYEIVEILASGAEAILSKGKDLYYQELKRALIGGKFHTVMGELRFQKSGDVLRPVYEVMVQDGQFIRKSRLLY